MSQSATRTKESAVATFVMPAAGETTGTAEESLLSPETLYLREADAKRRERAKKSSEASANEPTQKTDDKEESFLPPAKRSRIEAEKSVATNLEEGENLILGIQTAFGPDSEHSLLLSRILDMRKTLKSASEQMMSEHKLVLETLLEPAIVLFEITVDELRQKAQKSNSTGTLKEKLFLLQKTRAAINKDMEQTVALLPKDGKWKASQARTIRDEPVPMARLFDALFARALAWSSILVHAINDADLVRLEDTNDVERYVKWAMEPLLSTAPQTVSKKTQRLGSVRVMAPNYPQKTFPNCTLLQRESCKQATPPCSWQADRCVAPAAPAPYLELSDRTQGRVGQEPTFQTNKLLASLSAEKQSKVDRLFEMIQSTRQAMQNRFRLSELRSAASTASSATAALVRYVTPSPLSRDKTMNILKSIGKWGTVGFLAYSIPVANLLADASASALASWAQILMQTVVTGGLLGDVGRQLLRGPRETQTAYQFEIDFSKPDRKTKSILTRAAARRKREREQKKSSKASD